MKLCLVYPSEGLIRLRINRARTASFTYQFARNAIEEATRDGADLTYAYFLGDDHAVQLLGLNYRGIRVRRRGAEEAA